mmetsp:Transcript_98477/g.287190  ORF Transcript_98477/g.287190 Transcript_98477/m.287190 type:complete len:215 (-) Transcript_98477:2612-3256(-)
MGLATRGCAAMVGHLGHSPRAESGSAAAGCGAGGPLSPVAPETVLARWQDARLRVAGLDLLFVHRLAHLASPPRHLRDLARAPLLAPAAGGGAGAPALPLAPLAVILGTFLRGTGRKLGKLQAATNATRVPQVQHLAMPLPVCRAARDRAVRPLLPITYLAVLEAAWVLVAAHGLHQLLWATGTTVVWEDHDLSLPLRLASSASLVAVVPRGPL